MLIININLLIYLETNFKSWQRIINFSIKEWLNFKLKFAVINKFIKAIFKININLQFIIKIMVIRYYKLTINFILFTTIIIMAIVIKFAINFKEEFH